MLARTLPLIQAGSVAGVAAKLRVAVERAAYKIRPGELHHGDLTAELFVSAHDDAERMARVLPDDAAFLALAADKQAVDTECGHIKGGGERWDVVSKCAGELDNRWLEAPALTPRGAGRAPSRRP